ncbi:MAG: class I SAM-dependent methyltransferase [Rhodospirillales bacterium]
MSRLDSAIRRLEAQRACLGLAARLIAGIPGPVVELGLGNGRSYDHLRLLLPGREIFAFDRQLDAHPDCVPDPRHLVLGDFKDTLPAALERIGAPAALIHADTGTGEAGRNAKLAAWLAPHLAALAAPGGVIASDQELTGIAAAPLPLPEGVRPGRYFLYRMS